MLIYAVKRIGLALLIVLVAMTLLFGMIYLVPGDPASIALGPRATPEMKAALQRAHGARPADPGAARPLLRRRAHRRPRRRRLVEPQRRDDRPRGPALHAGADRASGSAGRCRSASRSAASRRSIAAAGSTGRSACSRSSAIAVPSFVVAIYACSSSRSRCAGSRRSAPASRATSPTSCAIWCCPRSPSGSAGSATSRAWCAPRCSR